jgi:hypothetical protein
MRRGAILGAILGAAAAMVTWGGRYLRDPTGTAPGGPFEGMDPRFSGMDLAHIWDLLPGAVGLVVAGSILGALTALLVRRIRSQMTKPAE